MPFFDTAHVEVVFRSEEDEALEECDGTCANGTRCLCITDVGTEKAGKAFFPGNAFCILCTRHRVQTGASIAPYVNYDVEFDKSVLNLSTHHTIGAFVRYDRSDYRLLPEFPENDSSGKELKRNSIDQSLLPFPSKKKEDWLTRLFEVRNRKFIPQRATGMFLECSELTSIYSEKQRFAWSVCVCMNPWCNANILSYVSSENEVGIKDVAIDVIQSTTNCMACGSEVHYIYPDSKRNIVDVNIVDGTGTKQTRTFHITTCVFCNVLIYFNAHQTLQTCSSCCEEFKEQTHALDRVCHYCSIPITAGRRSGNGFQVQRIGNKDVLLCRKHRLKQRKI